MDHLPSHKCPRGPSSCPTQYLCGSFFPPTVFPWSLLLFYQCARGPSFHPTSVPMVHPPLPPTDTWSILLCHTMVLGSCPPVPRHVVCRDKTPQASNYEDLCWGPECRSGALLHWAQGFAGRIVIPAVGLGAGSPDQRPVPPLAHFLACRGPWGEFHISCLICMENQPAKLTRTILFSWVSFT